MKLASLDKCPAAQNGEFTVEGDAANPRDDKGRPVGGHDFAFSTVSVD
jgi:hypothetical protein